MHRFLFTVDCAVAVSPAAQRAMGRAVYSAWGFASQAFDSPIDEEYFGDDYDDSDQDDSDDGNGRSRRGGAGPKQATGVDHEMPSAVRSEDQNLASGCRVYVEGLKSKPECNGKEAVHFD